MIKAAILFISITFGVIPNTYQFGNLNESGLNDGLLSNTVIDIEHLNDSVFLSTAKGLGGSNYVNPNFLFYNFEDINLPDGGNPAMVVKNNIIAVSGSGTEYHAG